MKCDKVAHDVGLIQRQGGIYVRVRVRFRGEMKLGEEESEVGFDIRFLFTGGLNSSVMANYPSVNDSLI